MTTLHMFCVSDGFQPYCEEQEEEEEESH